MKLERRISQLLPHDKCLHFIAGILIFAIFHFFIGSMALYVVLAVGALKEVYDSRHHGDVSGGDIFATMAGGLAGYLCGIWAV